MMVAAIGLLGAAAPACAANAGDPPLAAPGDAGGGEAEAERPAVTVTARRRPEDAQTVPLSLSVVDAGLIEKSYTVNTRDLTVLVPALNYSSANPRNTAFTIRGLGSSVVAVSQANDGLEPGVGFYVDQVYHARPATAAFDFVDLERVEVLRGPQGTVFGKNTTAGAIHLITKPPSFTPEATAEISYGAYNFLQVRAAATGPVLGDSIAARISALITRRDGVIRNVRTGQLHNDVNNEALRGQLLWVPSTDLSFKLTIDYANFRSNCCTQVYLRVGQSLRPAARQYPALAAGIGYAPASTNPYDRLTDIDADLGVDTNEGGISLISDWTLGRIGTLTAVSAWRFWRWDAANDRDYTGIPIQLTQHIPSRQDQYSHELRLASDGARRLNYVAGLYYFYQKISGRPISIYGPQAAYWLLGPAPQFPANLLDGYGTDGRTRFRTDSYAAFGEIDWRIVDGVRLSGGLRYTHEDKSANYDTFVFGGLATTSTTLRNAQLSVLRPQNYAARSREGNLSGRASLAYTPLPAITAYASFARGFKSGGINVSGLPLDAQNRPVLTTAVIRPELNTTYEIGFKSQLFGDRLTLNVDGYYTSVRDFQATIVDSSQTVALRGYLSNIPLVRVTGVEADATARLARNLSLRFALAYADGRYARYPQGPCPLERQTSGTTACDLTGRSLAGLPRWSMTLGGDYSRPLPALGAGTSAFLHFDSNWRSGYAGDPSLSRFTYINAYNLTNASIGLRFGKGWEVAVFARNLFDADYIQNVTIQAGNSGLILGTPSDPRVAGLTMRLRS